MTAVSFYVEVVKALDEIGAPYMIVGAFDRRIRREFDVPIDYELLAKEALRIGPDTSEMWNHILVKAKEEVSKRKT